MCAKIAMLDINNKIKNKISIYIRVSTEDQAREGYSLEVQRGYLEDFAKREGYEVYKVYCDDGVNAYFIRRPALQELLKNGKGNGLHC